MFGFFVCGFALMCGGVNGTAIGGPGQLGGAADADIDVHRRLVRRRRSRLGPLRHDRLLPDRRRPTTRRVVVLFLFMMVFMDTTATIATGAWPSAGASRASSSSASSSARSSTRSSACWVWGGGWLAQLGYELGLGHGAVDYAGSGVVHLQGGVAGADHGASSSGRASASTTRTASPSAILGHHIPMVQLGTFILAFGWFGFNAGTSLAGTDGRIGIVAVNTMLAGMAATISGVLYMWCSATRSPIPSMMCNGMLAGPGRHHRARARSSPRWARSSSAPRRRAGRRRASSSSTSIEHR